MPRVYTEEQKQRARERATIHYYKNRETKKEYQKEYYNKNKEIINKTKKIYMKNYRQTPAGLKGSSIGNWKRMGVVSTDYNLLYDNYLASTNCEECGIEYGKMGDETGTYKCLDHCHETGLFRNYICCRCNLKRR